MLEARFESKKNKFANQFVPSSHLDIKITDEELECLDVAFTCADIIKKKNSLNITERFGADNFNKLKDKLSDIENKLFGALEFYGLSHMLTTFDYIKPNTSNVIRDDYWGYLNILFTNVNLFTNSKSKLANSIICEQIHRKNHNYLSRNIQNFCCTKKRRELEENVLVTDVFDISQDFVQMAIWPALRVRVEVKNSMNGFVYRRIESYGALLWDVAERRIYMKSVGTLKEGKRIFEL